MSERADGWSPEEADEYVRGLVPPDLDQYRRDDEAEEARFVGHMNAEDASLIVLRGHLWIESRLTRLIEHMMERPDQFDVGRYGFAQKLDLAVALGVIPLEARPGLSALNKLRNRMAHRLDAPVTPEDERELVRRAHESSPWLDGRLREQPADDAFPSRLRHTLEVMFATLGRAYEEKLQAEVRVIETLQRSREQSKKDLQPLREAIERAREILDEESLREMEERLGELGEP